MGRNPHRKGGTLDKLEPIDTRTLHARAYEQMRKALMSGMLKPGEAVTLRGVSQALGTSVMPVRDAVRRLVAERALEMPTSRSLRVPVMSRQQFDNLIDLRLMLEGAATAQAAAMITEDEVEALCALDGRIAQAVRQHDFSGMLEANEQFHFRIYAAAHNDLLFSMIESLWLQGGPYLGLLLEDPTARRHYNDHSRHLDVIEALRRRDRRAAKTAIGRDIGDAAKLFRAHLGARLLCARSDPTGDV